MKYLFILVTFFSTNVLSAQFRSFGTNPTQAHDSLFINMDNAEGLDASYNATLELIKHHKNVGNLDSIIFYSSTLLVKLGNHQKDKIAFLSHLIGDAKFNKGLTEDALSYYLKGIEESKNIPDQTLYFQNRLGLALTKMTRNDENDGFLILNECIDNAPNDKVKYDARNYIGQYMFMKNRLKEAYTYIEEAYNFYRQNGHSKQALKMRLTLAQIRDKQGKKQQALEEYTDIHNIAYEQSFFDLYISTTKNIGNYYIQQNSFENAQRVLSSAYINAIQWGNLNAQKEVLKALHILHRSTGDYKNAYAIMTQLRSVDKTILKNQNGTQVNELEIKYESLEKEQEISRQKTQKKNILIGFLVVLIPLLALFYTYYQKLQTQSKLNTTLKEVNAQKVAALIKDQELELIKSSIKGEEKERNRIAKELHDSIGGNLASIKLQLSSDRDQKIIKQIDDTYNQVRDISHNLMPQKFQENPFTLLLGKYIDNINTSSKEMISLHIHPEEDVNSIDERIKVELYKIIQELLTNALKHAEANEINIHITHLGEEIKLLFEDDGKGIDTETIVEGIGLQNIKARIASINGMMRIDTHPQRGTIVDIDVPLLENK